ncbi:tripartite tricarboxylate transporter substrate binding protein [Alcaligenaceae bacterium]|nr:tripartite tricarboxylate transporter substrate binding protein [Alcaligenaceae bacterium]
MIICIERPPKCKPRLWGRAKRVNINAALKAFPHPGREQIPKTQETIVLARKLIILLAVSVSLIGGAGLAEAAERYPAKPVTIIVPQSSGGATDFLARLVAEKLSQSLGVSFIVENKPGAGGIIGLQSVAQAANDGYTLLMSSDGPQAINVSLYKDLPYDPIKDFTPIATIGSVSFLLIVRDDYPAKDFGEFLETAKSNPGTEFGSAGIGSLNHLIGEMINHETNASMRHVPYKGAAASLTDLLGGHVPSVIASIPSVASQVDAKKIRALAVSSSQRSPRFPDVPAVSEFGFTEFGVSPWVGLLGPGGMPPEIVATISEKITEILGQDDVKEKIAGLGMEVLEKSPADFSVMLKDDIDKWARVAAAADIQKN